MENVRGLWGECGDRVDGDKGMIGYVGGRVEKMEWEDIGKYRVRGGKCRGMVSDGEVGRVGNVSNILRGRHYPIIIYTYILCDIADGLKALSVNTFH